MHFIEAHLTLNKVTFSMMEPAEIDQYISKFYAAGEKQSYEQDLANAVSNGWLHFCFDDSFYAEFGKNFLRVDPETNTLIVTWIAYEIDQLCKNIFDPPKVGYNPLRNYLNAHPEEGSYYVKIYDSNNNDVTNQYYK